MRRIDMIVIHCSDSPDGRRDTAEDIHRWHKERGWDGIGYHYVICRDGTVENGRPEYWAGSHAKGHNENTIGVCMIGSKSFETVQWVALERVAVMLMSRYPKARFVGHRDLDPGKTCPNFDVRAWAEKRGLG